MAHGNSAGIQITHAVTPTGEVLIDSLIGNGFHAAYLWAGGSQSILPLTSCCGGMDYGTRIDRSIGPSRSFGWQVTCSIPTCGKPAQILDVRGIELEAVDTTRPDVWPSARKLWYQDARWVRGANWPASFQASANDGICATDATVDGKLAAGPTDLLPNQHSWTQCPATVTMPLTIDTTGYPNGPLSISLSAKDAASPANVASPSETLRVDNAPVALSLTGPTDAPSTAGAQHVSASATAGPSGVAQISCSTD